MDGLCRHVEDHEALLGELANTTESVPEAGEEPKVAEVKEPAAKVVAALPPDEPAGAAAEPAVGEDNGEEPEAATEDAKALSPAMAKRAELKRSSEQN